MMNLQRIRYFLEVAHHLNFSQAAQKLFISQPALSQQIAQLESQLGVQLFKRTTKNVSLTAEGEYLYKNLISSFQHIDHLLNEIMEVGAVPQSTLNIATVPSAASNWVPNLLKKLQQSQADFGYFIHETNSLQAIDLIKRQKYDLAFIRTPLNISSALDESVSMIEFTRHPLQLVVSRNHRLASLNEIDLYELKDDTFIHYDAKQSPTLHYQLEQACITAGFVPKTMGSGPELLTIANLIAQGLGVTLMPADMISLLPKEKIKAIPFKKLNLFSSISVIWNHTGYIPELKHQAITYLQACET